MAGPQIVVDIDVRGLTQLEQAKAIANAIEPEIKKLEKEVAALGKKGQTLDSEKLERFRALEEQKKNALDRAKEIKEHRQEVTHLGHELHTGLRVANRISSTLRQPAVQKLLHGEKLEFGDYLGFAQNIVQDERVISKAVKVFGGSKQLAATLAEAGPYAVVAAEAINFAKETIEKRLEGEKITQKAVYAAALGIDKSAAERLLRTNLSEDKGIIGFYKGEIENVLQIVGIHRTAQEVEKSNQVLNALSDKVSNGEAYQDLNLGATQLVEGQEFRQGLKTAIGAVSPALGLFISADAKGANGIQAAIKSGALKKSIADAEEEERKRLGVAALSPEQRANVDRDAFKRFVDKFGENGDELAKKIDEMNEKRKIELKALELRTPAYVKYNDMQNATILEKQRQDHYKRTAAVIED
jgi:hypothetical protein